MNKKEILKGISKNHKTDLKIAEIHRFESKSFSFITDFFF